MALGAWALGALLLAAPALWRPAALALARPATASAPRASTSRASTSSTTSRPRSTTSRCAICAAASRRCSCRAASSSCSASSRRRPPRAFSLGTVDGTDLLVVAMLALVAVAAIVVTTTHEHVSIVLALAVVGLGLATVYALLGAPDVALVAMLVETVVTLVFLAIVAYAPRGERPTRRELEGHASRPHRRAHQSRRWRDPLIGAVAGGAAFLVVWASLSRPAATERVVDQQVALTPEAHGKDVVTVILADFRGLDTMVEITVIAVAVFGVIALLRRGGAGERPHRGGRAAAARACADGRRRDPREGLRRRRRRLQRRRRRDARDRAPVPRAGGETDRGGDPAAALRPARGDRRPADRARLRLLPAAVRRPALQPRAGAGRDRSTSADSS